MQVIGFVLAIGLISLQQDEGLGELSPAAVQALSDWEQCISSNVSRASRSADSAEVAADGLLEYCRDQQRAARAVMALEFGRQMGRDGEETTNSLETMLVMKARQNILSQIAAERRQ